MTSQSALYAGAVMHRRWQPRVHRFRYRAFWLLIDLDELTALTGRLRLFSHNHFNLFAEYFNVNDIGYWEDDNYILLRKESDETIAKKFSMSVDAVKKEIAEDKKCDKTHAANAILEDKRHDKTSAVNVIVEDKKHVKIHAVNVVVKDKKHDKTCNSNIVEDKRDLIRFNSS